MSKSVYADTGVHLQTKDVILYAPVTDPEERQKMLSELATSQDVLSIHYSEHEEIQLKASSLTKQDDGKLFLKAMPITNSKLARANENQRVFFQHKNLSYYFFCEIKIARGEVQLIVGDELFQQQNRSHFRLNLPDGYPAIFSVFQVDGEVCDFTVPVVDFNELGMGLKFPDDKKIEVNFSVFGQLFLGVNSPVTVAGIVKSKIPREQGQFLIGIEFSYSLQSSEAELHDLIGKVRKDLFQS